MPKEEVREVGGSKVCRGLGFIVSKAPGMRKEAREGVIPRACAAAIRTLKFAQLVRAI